MSKSEIGARLRSGWDSVKLLLWKNFLIQYRHPIQSAVEILLPCLLVLIVAIFRLRIDVHKHPEGRNYTALRLNEIPSRNIAKFAILYTPDTAPYDTIINDTIDRLDLAWDPTFNGKLLICSVCCCYLT